MTAAPDSATPKPCPACGWERDAYLNHESDDAFQYQCLGCFSLGPMKPNEKLALAAWNALPRRDELPPFDIKELQDTVSECHQKVDDILVIASALRQPDTPAPRAAEPRTLNIATMCPHCRAEAFEIERDPTLSAAEENPVEVLYHQGMELQGKRVLADMAEEETAT